GAQVLGIAWTPSGTLIFGYWLVLLKDQRYAGTVQKTFTVDTSGAGNATAVMDDAQYPSLSRTGNALAFTTQKDTGEGGLWIAGGDGKNGRQLVELGPDYVSILYPRVSPDGNTIVFSAVSSR